jgi:hypothetical protein
MIDLKSLENMNLDSILDALPASFVNSAQQLQVRRSTQRPQGAWNGSSGKEVLQRVLISSTQ